MYTHLTVKPDSLETCCQLSMRTGCGADGTVFISGLSPVCYISCCTASLHRQAKIKMPILTEVDFLFLCLFQLCQFSHKSKWQKKQKTSQTLEFARFSITVR